MYNLSLPTPILDQQELDQLDILINRYNKLTRPNSLSKLGENINKKIPSGVKEFSANIKSTISEQEIYFKTMKIIGDSFKVLEEKASKYSLSEDYIIDKIRNIDFDVQCLDEICMLRSYKISHVVNTHKTKDVALAFVEGGTTGVAGFIGIPFNLALSTLLYFRAVQSIAMFYGFDVKNNPTELIIASEVFSNSLSPKNSKNELSGNINKMMLITQDTILQEAAKKTYSDIASRSSIPLFLAQIKTLANKSAQKSIEKASGKGLENIIFKGVFERIGQKLALKSVQRAIPIISAGIGAFLDTTQMKKVIEFADIFYHKRYILEKKHRINLLLESKNI
ncbi:hypothetical protein AN640_05035 [Candidatus Epulonipiscium fishelsonii]|uniref:Uncharacterized protein n=1 Tax=Candidatus Epulonipiscium fishelsonii TaxID=77094 RepID=A0ACC8XI64_9FIRM|nr:hypothetical protein AN640_05035 [Epulopiscium sp. SCG-D08WGA-EpuloA1]